MPDPIHTFVLILIERLARKPTPWRSTTRGIPPSGRIAWEAIARRIAKIHETQGHSTGAKASA